MSTKPTKVLVTVAGKEFVMDGFYLAYEVTKNKLSVCTDGKGHVLSIENLTPHDTYDLFYKDELMVGLKPGSKMSFGHLRVNTEDLKTAVRSVRVFPDQDLDESDDDISAFDCND